MLHFEDTCQGWMKFKNWLLENVKGKVVLLQNTSELILISQKPIKVMHITIPLTSKGGINVYDGYEEYPDEVLKLLIKLLLHGEFRRFRNVRKFAKYFWGEDK